MLARENAVGRECKTGRRRRAGQKEYKGKQRSIVSRGRLAGFHAGDAIENDTSTQHRRNTLALILISLFLVVS